MPLDDSDAEEMARLQKEQEADESSSEKEDAQMVKEYTDSDGEEQEGELSDMEDLDESGNGLSAPQSQIRGNNRATRNVQAKWKEKSLKRKRDQSECRIKGRTISEYLDHWEDFDRDLDHWEDV